MTRSRGEKADRQLIEIKEWKEMVETIEMHDQGLTDTLAISVDPEAQNIIKEGEKDIKSGKLVPCD